MSYILSKELNTRYITDYHENTLRVLLEKLKAEFTSTGVKPVLDLRFCKFTVNIPKLLQNYYEYVKFVDTDNPYINGILKHNNSVPDMVRKSKESILPCDYIASDISIADIPNYISNLSPSKIYRIPDNSQTKNGNNMMSVYVAIMIAFRNPEIAIDVSRGADRFYRIIRDNWYNKGKLTKHDSYRYFIKGNFIKLNRITKEDITDESITTGYRVTEKEVGKFYIAGVGFITEEMLVDNYPVIPSDIGERMLVGAVARDTDGDEFKPIMRYCIEMIGKLKQQSSKKEKTLLEYVKPIEGSK